MTVIKQASPARRRRTGFSYGALIKWLLILFFAIYTIFPLLWLVMSSLKTNTELFGSPFALPAVWQTVNYQNAFRVSGMPTMMGNSILIGLSATLLNVVVASMLAYCLSRFSFKGNSAIFTMFSAGILVPLNALMVPYFITITNIGLYNTRIGLTLLYAGTGIPMSTVIIRGLMGGISKEIEEAAYIDGCSFYGRFTRIIFPLSRNGIMTAATFQFITCWNEFVFANLLTSSQNVRTIQLGIRYFTNQFSTDFVSMYAAIVVSILPSILLYVIFQNQIIAGLTSGAIKG